ncbi:MAG: VOC family protein [bacterium]
MKTINPYLTFNGNAEDAFNFYKSVFGGELMIMRFKDSPDSDKVKKEDGEKIMHISLPLNKLSVLMASDHTESMGYKMKEGNNFSISISTESREETDKLFKALSDGAQVTMPLTDVFWGAYFGMLTDKFGIQWLLSFDK